MLAASDNKGLVGDIKSEMAAAVDSLRKKRGKGGGAERSAAKEASHVYSSNRKPKCSNEMFSCRS
jgi:hypothetical protein